MPAASGRILRPPGLLHQQGPGRLLAAPGLECLPEGTRARDSRYEPDLALQTYAQGPATIGLAVCPDPAHALTA
jgi:hypothetical protein